VKQADIASNKRLDSLLQRVKEQLQVQSIQRSKAAAKRRDQQRICKTTSRNINPVARSANERSTCWQQRQSTAGHFYFVNRRTSDIRVDDPRELEGGRT
jgi:hypothetical protein